MTISRKQPFAGAAGVALLALAGLALWWALGNSEAARAPATASPVPVVTTVVEKRDVAEFSRGVGTVQSLHSVVVRPQVSGILTEVLFQEGEMVQAGDLLARIDDRSIAAELEQARAARSRNQALLDQGVTDLERYKSLVRDNTIAEQTLDQQAARVAELRAAVAADTAAVTAAEVQLSYTRIASPVTGRTGLRRVDPGNLVSSSETGGLVSVTQLDPIAVVFALPQDLLPRLRTLTSRGTASPVRVYDRVGGTLLSEGTLSLMDNEVNVATGTVRLKAEFANPEGALWPGQFVTAELQTANHAQALVVDVQAVQRGRDESFVYRVTSGRAEYVPVTIGYEDDHVAIVERGLAEGDQVVRDGHSRLKPDAEISVTTR